MAESQTLIEVKDLKTYFHTEDGVVRAVDGVDLKIERGRTLGIVGESGSGKTVFSRSIMRIVQEPPGRISGKILLHQGRDKPVDLAAFKASASELRHIRGREIGMIFQEPMSSFSPIHTVGNQIMEALLVHEPVSRREARRRAIEMIGTVGIPRPAERIDAYPFELSGGMRQRAMIAMALMCNPALLIADEPTTALDVTVEAAILNLMKSLQDQLGMTIMIITHDLGVIAKVADEVAVMYLGKVVEQGQRGGHLPQPAAPLHPGAAALDAAPRHQGGPARVDHGNRTRPLRRAAGVHLLPSLQRSAGGALQRNGARTRRGRTGSLGAVPAERGDGKWLNPTV